MTAFDPKQREDEIKQQQTAAANIVREKLAGIYKDEPKAKEELSEVKELTAHHSKLSKHQKYMDDLSRSGRSLAEIQTAWHEYYQNLPDQEKHAVWEEFYSQHEKKRTHNSGPSLAASESSAAKAPKPTSQYPEITEQKQIKRLQPKRISRKKRHFHSLVFGLSMGSLTVLILLFSFFNERFIAPFIRPSQNVSATSIIVDPSQNSKVGSEPKIIIPKINIEAPVVYDEPSVNEKAIQKALERGVVHYAITPNPGEKGNSVIVGHSSSNILNSGKYKFAFLLLKSLEKDDTFIIHKDGQRYVYKIYKKFVTNPTDLSVLDPTSKPTVTLITCDPPGLSTNRLIIQGEQIFPDPNKNVASTVDSTKVEAPEELGGNAPSLWQRFKDWLRN